MFALIALISLSAATADDGLNDDEREYLARIIAVRDATADQVRQHIAWLESQAGKHPPKQARRLSAGNSGPSRVPTQEPKPGTKAYREKQAAERDQAKSELKDCRSQLERLKTGVDVPDIGGVGFEQSGSIGYLKSFAGEMEVIQKIGPADMLVMLSGLFGRGDGSGVQHESHIYWIQGFPTAKYAEHEKLSGFNELVINAGTKTYTTVLQRQSTVYVLRPANVDRNKVLAAYRERCKPIEAKPQAQARPEGEAKPAAPLPPADPEADAQKRFGALLSNSRKLIKAGVYDAARKNLARIVKEAPGTAIAAEAQKELDQLANR